MIKLQKTLAVKAEVMCIDVKHRHMVFTIPFEYREYFRKERDALNILFIASRNTLMKVFNKSLFDKVRRRGIESVSCEIMLMALAINIRKLFSIYNQRNIKSKY